MCVLFLFLLIFLSLFLVFVYLPQKNLGGQFVCWHHIHMQIVSFFKLARENRIKIFFLVFNVLSFLLRDSIFFACVRTPTHSHAHRLPVSRGGHRVGRSLLAHAERRVDASIGRRRARGRAHRVVSALLSRRLAGARQRAKGIYQAMERIPQTCRDSC
jgi:hypothetical protein